MFQPGPVSRAIRVPFFERPVSGRSGDQHYLDATIAYRRACLNAINYLNAFGFSGEQAYILLCAARRGPRQRVVDIPNACCSIYLPTEIFDFDIPPEQRRPALVDRGQCATAS